MKRLLSFFLLLLLGAGCKKTEHQYTVVCDFPLLFRGQAWLVVTNDAATILQIFDLPQGATQFIGKFNLEADHAPDTYNLHLVFKSDTYPDSKVASYYGVQNGAAVSFWPFTLYAVLPRVTLRRLFIRGIEAVDSVIIPGNYITDVNIMYDTATQTAQIAVYLLDQADWLVRIRTSQSAPFRTLYLPQVGLNGDSTTVEWTDFLPDEHFVMLELPDSGPADYVEVSAVEPDFKRFATLFLGMADAYQPALTPGQVAIPIPIGLHPQSHFRVRMHQGDFTAEKMFRPGEALRMDSPDLSIRSALFSPLHTLRILTGGHPDLVEVNILAPASNQLLPTFQWNIQGPPEAFVQMALPDLTSLLPDLPASGLYDHSWQVTAYQYDQLDYAQLRAGFPYKGNDGRVFPIARYGLEKMTRRY